MTQEIVEEINNTQGDVQALAAGYNNVGIDTSTLKRADSHLEEAKFDVLEFDSTVTPEEPLEESVFDHGKEEEMIEQTQG